MLLTLVVINFLALISLPTPSLSERDNTACISSLRFPVQEIGSYQQAGFCPPSEMLRREIDRDIDKLLRNTTIPAIQCCAAQRQASPAASCSALPTSYWLLLGQEQQWYCSTSLL